MRRPRAPARPRGSPCIVEPAPLVPRTRSIAAPAIAAPSDRPPQPIAGRSGAVAASRPYTLDSGDKLRVVVFGQDGLTASYSVDTSGSITMPLIGAVPARGRTTAGAAGGDRRQAAQRLCARAACRGRGRGLSAVLHPGRGHPARPVSVCAEHDRRDRGRDRGRLHARAPGRRPSSSAAPATASSTAARSPSTVPSGPAIPSSSPNDGSEPAVRAPKTPI